MVIATQPVHQMMEFLTKTSLHTFNPFEDNYIRKHLHTFNPFEDNYIRKHLHSKQVSTTSRSLLIFFKTKPAKTLIISCLINQCKIQRHFLCMLSLHRNEHKFSACICQCTLHYFVKSRKKEILVCTPTAHLC
jgi:hypothetical protein